MTSTVKRQTTKSFIERSPFICLLITISLFIALIVAQFVAQPVLSRAIEVEPEETVTLPAINLQRDDIGALRIDVKAVISSNRWVTYEIQLRDEGGQIIASAVKPAWKESGRWYEDGESGTWQEEDLRGGLDVQPGQKTEARITPAIAVLEYTDTAGVEIEQPVRFRVTVKNNVVDSRYLWAGIFGTTCLSILCFFSVAATGTTVINKTIPDSDVGAREVLGGKEKLVRMTVKVKADEIAPRQLRVNFWLKDGFGKQKYGVVYDLNLIRQRRDGELIGSKGKIEKYFILEKRASYGFYLEVTPDASVDETQLIVKEGVKTTKEVEVIKISEN